MDRGWGAEATDDDRIFATLAHLCAFVLPALGPAALWYWKGPSSAFIRFHTVQAFLLQLLLVWVLGLPSLGLGVIVACIMSALWAKKAYDGLWLGFPMLDQIGRG
jgi:hypothetical protein